jgi:hypothetical protein
LTVRTDAHADEFDLRAAAESEAAKTITEQTKDVRDLLLSKLKLLWDWALEQPQSGNIVTRAAVIWESPTTTLKKMCNRMKIPRPPQGYWSTLPDLPEKFVERANRSHHGGEKVT